MLGVRCLRHLESINFDARVEKTEQFCLHSVGSLREHKAIRVNKRKDVDIVGIEPRSESSVVGLVAPDRLEGEVLDSHCGDPDESQCTIRVNLHPRLTTRERERCCAK